MKYARRVFITIVLLPLLTFCLLPSDVGADTTVRVTFVAGGVACGVSFFIYFSTGNFSAMLDRMDDNRTAVFNHGSEGWKMEYPLVNLIKEGRSDYIPYVEIMKYEF